jgi:hypothetical protein
VEVEKNQANADIIRDMIEEEIKLHEALME